MERVGRFKLHALTAEQADAFAKDWRRVQALFVDDPHQAVTEADTLVAQVMAARGYPLEESDRVPTISRSTTRASSRTTASLAA